METTTEFKAVPAEARPAAGAFRPFNLKKRPRIFETVIQSFLFVCGVLSIFTTLGIVYVLGQESWLFFRRPEVSLVGFFGAFKWQPEIGNFGIWPLVNATLMTSLTAMLIAVPFVPFPSIFLLP